MYRSLYSYTSKEEGILPFRTGEHFSFIEQLDEHWWKMKAANGVVGLVPSSYLVPLEYHSSSERNAVLESIERAIETIHQQAAYSEGKYTKEHRDNLNKLLEHRKAILNPNGPTSPTNVSDRISGQQKFPGFSHQDSDTINLPVQPRRPAPTRPTRKQHSTRRAAPPIPVTGTLSANEYRKEEESTQGVEEPPVTVPPGTAAELLDLLRINTGLSYEKSFVAVDTMVSYLKQQIPSTARAMDLVMQDLIQQKEARSHSEDSLLESHDGERLQEILNNLTEHKEDSQQRSWALHEDEAVIRKLLDDLLHVLLEADPAVCRAVIQHEDYSYLHTLVLYYQMEERHGIRLLLIQVFGCLCGLDRKVITQLLCSVLPGELACDIMDNKQDVQRQCHCAILLTMIFYTGELVPFTVYDQLNQAFVSDLISSIESPPDGDEDELLDSFVPLLLAFNQHFIEHKNNIVMNVLGARGTAKSLSERIMVLVNRGDDPVAMFEHPRACPDSVLKFLTDIFSSPKTSGFFFTTDMMVLLEIVLRQLTDLLPGDKTRTEYLSLLHQVFSNTNYSEHKHKSSDFSQCLKRISQEEETDAEQDRQIVQEIFRQFSRLLH